MKVRDQQRSRLFLLVPVLLVSLTTLTITLAIVGNLKVHSVPGLPHSPEITLWLLPVSRLISDLSGMMIVGALLVTVFLLPRPDAKLVGQSQKLAELTSYFAFTYAAANSILIVFAISDVLGVSPSQALDPRVMRSYLTQLTGGRVSLFQVIAGLLISVLVTRIRSSIGGLLLFVFALLAVGAPALTGHSGLSANHEIAASSSALHIVALSIWIGGLITLAFLVKTEPVDFWSVVQRFSRVALGCYLAVILSGIANAWVRLRSFENLFGSSYGRLVLLKIALALLLAYLGWLNRNRALRLSRGGSNSFFYRIASIEVAIMFAVVGIAVTLSRTSFPTEVLTDSIRPSASELLYGFELPPPPSVSSFLVSFRFDALWLAFALILLALYMSSLLRVRRGGIAWPTNRPIFFGIGILLTIYATSGGLSAYSHVLFSAHMVQHILLLLIIPEFLVAGQPFRLAEIARSLSEADTPSIARDILDSRAIKTLSSLPVVAGLFASSFYFLYFTPIFDAWMPSHWGHVGMEVIIFLIGYLFIWNIFGDDLTPVVHSPWSRFRFLLISEPFHILFSVLLIWSSRTLAGGFYSSLQRPYAQDLAHDQILGGILGWLLGELPMFLAGGLLIRALVRRNAGSSQRA